ncbi:MAG: hypothetical protein GOVbin4580_23 [Prokaryotic dsDNA virus sp.]|jgi:hypothetical protein|nr:MAG: hypothetical protein GOVbin4580_23 [Prokaryotic dsDNA virus sp.]|tara:strand:+ start:11815 stop:12213 length:399 start_codon:yes stop_codon:yes gene_type:complete
MATKITAVKFGEDTSGTNNGNYSPSTNPSIGVRYSNAYRGITVNRALDNTAYTVERYGRKKGFQLNYTFLPEADRDKLEALVAYTVGQKKSFFFSPAGTFSDDIEVRFTQNNFEFNEVAPNVYSTTINFEEV